MKKSYCSILSTALIVLGTHCAFSQNAPYWSYQGTGTSISVAFSNTVMTMPDSQYAEIGGVNMSDSQYDRWEMLYSSEYLFGRNSRLVRGYDVLEDWDLNWSTPALYPLPSSSRWVSVEGSHTSATWVFKNVYNGGPHAGQQILGNTNIIALMDDHAIFWDGDGTLSAYNLGGGSYVDYTWNTLTGGGVLNNRTLDVGLLQAHFIGAEELQAAFLVGSNQVDFYNIITGVYIRSADYSGVTTGPLGSYSLIDIIDGKVDGWSFAGIDNIIPGPVFVGLNAPIPEPSTFAVFLAGMALTAGFRRRFSRIS